MLNLFNTFLRNLFVEYYNKIIQYRVFSTLLSAGVAATRRSPSVAGACDGRADGTARVRVRVRRIRAEAEYSTVRSSRYCHVAFDYRLI